MKNVFKYLLIFLADAIYITKIENHLKQIKDIKIRTPDKIVTLTDFIESHIPEVK